MSLSAQILTGLLAGIATGLFLGELAAELKLIADIFVGLLQMTVLPYIMFSLVAGFGHMDMGLVMFLKGKIHPLPKRIKGLDEVKKLYEMGEGER